VWPVGVSKIKERGDYRKNIKTAVILEMKT
jgi:hypothetical protein